MSSALERVIAEQQARVDSLIAQLESAQKSSAHVWKQHEELFATLAAFLDADLPLDRSDADRAKSISSNAVN